MSVDRVLEQAIQSSGVRRCLECGKCTAVCPIVRFDGGLAPRATVRQALLGAADELLADDRLWTCINCLRCNQVCPANVDYSALTLAVRMEARRRGQSPLCTHGEAIHVWIKWMMQPGLKQARIDWLPSADTATPARLAPRQTDSAGLSLQGHHLPRVFERGERSGGPERNAVESKDCRAVEGRPSPGSAGAQSHQLHADQHYFDRELVLDQETSDTLFFVGCAPYFDALFASWGLSASESARASIRILNTLGIQPRVLADERCCGHDLLWEGDLEGFSKLARLNADMIRAADVKRVVAACPECVRALKVDYPAHGFALGVEVLHLSELLVQSPLATRASREPLPQVTFHDACRLGRHLGIYDAPREILRRLGYQVAEMAHSRRQALCCGTNGWTHCSAANKAIQLQRLSEARATGAELLVTACHKCQIHFACAQRDPAIDRASMPRIVDLATLVASHIEQGS